MQLCGRKRGETLIEVALMIGCYEERFLVPLYIAAVSQHVGRIIRMNRRLPIGHRVRGDVLA
jgi:hypothetical protein